MRLERPFVRLPILFDATRLANEVAALPQSAWVPHPDRVPGNAAVRLISADGGENDVLGGTMRPTRWLAAMPYARQVLASCGVVWGRARLMRLAAGARVPEHADVGHYWCARVRVHLPVVTDPAVLVHCGGEALHMAAGAAWVLDTWRRHRVENASAVDRIHLVADTEGSAAFGSMARGGAPPHGPWQSVAWTPTRDAAPLTEADRSVPIMPAADVQALVDTLRGELVASPATGDGVSRVRRLDQVLARFALEWRHLCARHGTDGSGRSDFIRCGQALHVLVQQCAAGVAMRTNGVSALRVVEARLLPQLVA
ncbi:aspartyl/asparaginyl beta-hydroxylase domain-containing protein [Sphingomonas sp. RHCKR7]|uniref:aspartyl/asparaginyl beta-hydroxylase domain-containing protein n=1 Tax=Sphingomonas folli TaxID=2862497 RepID=UPI001C66D8EF|nr:aspartyl/asparaginyl beta-hydroxylase domain-containing protein [Sphingomonas folli]MBW6526461.1 aspartyl/asparaginyl beta-hydroxylase domain-containing protein [Sphingomonas folli]